MPAELITVYGRDGQPVQIAREEWRTKVLPGTIRDAWNDASRLATIVGISLRDGFAADLVGAAERLVQIDPDREQAVILRAVVELECRRPAAAERLLVEFLRSSPGSAIALNNLAKAQANQGHMAEAEATLVRAIAADPNLDNALQWLTAINRDRGNSAEIRFLGEAGRTPGAWRPQLWLARINLERGLVDDALELYRAVGPIAKEHGDALMQISGDLGKAGRSADVVELVLPVYVPERHGPMAGLNLVSALIELGRLTEAGALLERLEAIGGPDLQGHLGHLRRELVTAEAVAREH